MCPLSERQESTPSKTGRPTVMKRLQEIKRTDNVLKALDTNLGYPSSVICVMLNLKCLTGLISRAAKR